MEKLMTTEDLDTGKTECALIEMAVETWRFARMFGRVVSRLDVGEQTRYATQLRYFSRKVEEHIEAAGLKLVNLWRDSPSTLGMAASAINLADFEPEDMLLSSRWSNRSSWVRRRPTPGNGSSSEGACMKYVGIDLGTTNSAICSFDGS